MRIELENNLSEMASAMAALETFSNSFGLEQTATQAAELVLDELLSNIIRYGMAESRAARIILDLDIVGDSLRIGISDGGIPFNPFDRAPPDLDLPLEEREPGGLGIYLVKKFMDEYDYQYLDHRNVVTLKKKLSPGPV
jgi:anti-sigma regulatory factor (Ser/Thr protein kinase)